MNTMRKRLVLPLALLLAVCFVASALAQEAPVKVHRKTTEPRTVAIIKHKGPYSDIPGVIDKLYAGIDKGGYVVCGPLMTVYYNDPGATPAAELRWDVRIPVTNPGLMHAVEDDNLGFGYQDPAYVAYTYHVGPYETVGESYGLLLDWARTNKYDITGYITEVHWSAPDAKNLVTEIWLPVREKAPADRAFR
jgi:effector-binding domain-containing protein